MAFRDLLASMHPSGLAMFTAPVGVSVEQLTPLVKSTDRSKVSTNSLVFKYVTASFFACDPLVSKSSSNLSKFSLLVGWTMMMSKNPSEGEASGADFVSPHLGGLSPIFLEYFRL